MSTPEELAVLAKTLGNAAFAKNTRDGYKEAAKQYQAATEFNPTDHILFANLGAALLELAKREYDKSRKVEMVAYAALATRRCTELEAAWAKGWMRFAAAEFALVAARKEWEEKDDSDKEEWEEEREKAAAEAKVACPAEALLPVIAAATYESCEATCRAGLATLLEHPDIALAMAEQIRQRLQKLRDAGHATDEAADRLLADAPASLAPKAEGNELFAEKKYEEAKGKYTAALALNPFDHVFYSNRSA
jgi:hypothetical protein